MSLAPLIEKEFRLFRSNVSLFISLLLFSLLLSFIFSFAFLTVGITPAEKTTLYPGLIVGTSLFICCALFNQTAILERDNGALQGLFLLGISGTKLFASKFIANILLFLVAELVNLLAFSLFFDPQIWRVFPTVIFIITLFALATCGLGTLLSLVSVVAPSRELLFSILFLPLILPVTIATVILLTAAFKPVEIDWLSHPAVLAYCSALIYTVISACLLDEVI